MTILAAFFFLVWLLGAINTVVCQREMFWVCFRQDLQFGGVLTGIWLALWAIVTLWEKLG